MSPAPSSSDRPTPWMHVADRCYWAILHEPCPSRLGRRDRQRLDFAFEGELPMPIEQVLTTYACIDDQRTLACAVDRRDADEVLDQGALVLRPREPPEFVGAAVPDAFALSGAINFLTGGAAAKPIRRSRTRVRAELAALLCIGTVLLLWGMQRRIDQSRIQVGELSAQRQAEIDRAIPSASVRDELTLLSELRRLERSRAPGAMPAGFEVGQDVTPALAEALQLWPPTLYARTQRLVASAGQLQFQAEVDAIEESELLAQALAQSERWNAGVPRVEAQGRGGFIATITLESAKENAQ